MQGAYNELANPQVSESPDVIANNKRALQVAAMQKAAQLGAAGMSAGASRYATDQRREAAQQQNQNYNKPSFGQPQIDAQGNFVQFDQSGNVKQHPIGAQPKGSDNYVAEATRAITAAAPMGVEPDTDPRVQQAMDEVWNRLGVGGEAATPQVAAPQGPAPVAPSMPGRDAQGNVTAQPKFVDFEGVQIPDMDADITGMRMTPQQYEATKRAYGVTDQDLKDLGVIVEGF
jgi:hypothetical protein